MKTDTREAVRRNLASAAWLCDLADSEQEHSKAQTLIGSAIYWIVAADELILAAFSDQERDRYQTQRANTPGGLAAIGLGVARDELAHGAALVVANEGLIEGMFNADGVMDYGGDWVLSEDLTDSAHGRGFKISKAREDAYRISVAGQRPTVPLRAALTFLEGWIDRAIT